MGDISHFFMFFLYKIINCTNSPLLEVKSPMVGTFYRSASPDDGPYVQVGDTVQAFQGMPMTNFESKSLNRTFDVVYFLGALENLSTPATSAMSEGQPSSALPPGHPSTDTAIETPTADIKVAELTPGQDIAYVYANKDSLAGQQISLRGEVVKFNSNILGTNFIHIQDGSGDVADGSNDLIVTSTTETAVGETIVLTGTIVLDKDFGAGYTFPILMEDASITTE